MLLVGRAESLGQTISSLYNEVTSGSVVIVLFSPEQLIRTYNRPMNHGRYHAIPSPYAYKEALVFIIQSNILKSLPVECRRF